MTKLFHSIYVSVQGQAKNLTQKQKPILSKSNRLLILFALSFLFITLTVICVSCKKNDSNSSSENEHDTYSIELKIKCNDNLILNRYNIDVFFDGKKLGTTKHGGSSTYKFTAKTGTYELRFTKAGSTKVVVTKSIKIKESGTFSYTLSCHNDEIKFESSKYAGITECKKGAHKWADATCTEEAVCTICKKVNKEPLGHKWIDATCTVPQTCERCKITEGKSLGHELGNWIIEIPATCGTDGKETAICSRCSQTCEQTVTKLGNCQYGDWNVTLQPSCSKEGTKERICNICQSSEKQNITVIAHTYLAPVVTKQASCSEKGEKTSVCSICNYKKTESIPTTQHIYIEKITKNATYYQPGEKVTVCSQCGAKKGSSSKYYIYNSVNLRTVFDAYRANEISANEKYDNMYIEFTGTISSIEKGGLLSWGTVCLEVANGSLWTDDVECKIKSSEQYDYIKSLNAGTRVTIKGQITSVTNGSLCWYMKLDIMNIK